MEVGCRFSPPSHNAGGVSSSVRAQAVLLDVWKRRGNSGVRRHSLPHCRRPNGLVIHAVAHPRRLARHQRPNAATLSPAETASDKAQSPETGNGSKPAEEVIQESAGPRVPVEKVVLIQAFGWDSCTKKDWYLDIQSKLPALTKKGFTGMWLPPPSQSVSAQGYLPGQLYNLNSKYGTEQHLVGLNKELKKIGISPIADIVINHRCADAQDENGVWNNFRDDVTHKGEKINWGTWAITSNDPEFGGTGNPDTGADYGPAPDLDHANPKLRAALKEWLTFLKDDIGFEGWRFDFVKGYAAEFVTEYVNETLPPNSFCVAEYWVDSKWEGHTLEYNQDEPRQILCNWLDACKQASCAFDFPMKGILQEAVKNTEYWRLSDPNGKPPGLIGWWPQRAVTFIDNHDTGSTQQHWPFPSSHIDLGYAYIFTHPGIPCVFWDHYFDPKLQETIDALIALRERAGIDAGAKVHIKKADQDMYVAVINDKVTLKLGPRFDMGDALPKESEGWKQALYGKDFCIWEK